MPDEQTSRTGELRDEDDSPYVVEQTNVGFRNMKGGGEWPDPDAPAQAPAPGSVPGEAAAIEARRRADRAAHDDGEPLLKEGMEDERGPSQTTPN